ncbi:hypothetical protein [Streptomyces sp. NPDC021224]|uniref:hypothetical protein n=1 Tax=unclassified Streptomyces TaxID=2593676 RepID=UPI00379D77BD
MSLLVLDVGMLDTCELTGLVRARCAHCLGTVAEDADPVRTSLLGSLSDWVRADHPGRCVMCGSRFPVGAAIAPEDEGWRADCCPRRAQ